MAEAVKISGFHLNHCKRDKLVPQPCCNCGGLVDTRPLNKLDDWETCETCQLVSYEPDYLDEGEEDIDRW